MNNRFFSFCLIVGSACSCLLLVAPAANADSDTKALEFESTINVLYADFRGITLGDDPSADRRKKREATVDFQLDYSLSDQFFVFFGGSFFNENETLKTSGLDSSQSGFEREQAGLAYLWGQDEEFELAIGRLEYTDEPQWWWDEFLDSLRLQIDQGNFKLLLAHGKELGRSRSNQDFIDPEQEDVYRSIAQIDWAISDNHQLTTFYLKQEDRSASYVLNQSLNQNRVDEDDSDLRWLGLSYHGQLSDESIGDIDFVLAYAHVSGNSTVYEFSDPNVTAIDQFDIDASSNEFSINWTPTFNQDLKVFVSRAEGSGDKNLGDSSIKTFRQTGLQGNETDFSYYGELYQPELSNILIESFGVSYEGINGFSIYLMRHAYRQDQLDTEMRDVAIDLDTDGINRRLGSEIDLVIIYEALDELEIKFIGAQFKAGSAYGVYAGEKSRYLSIEIDYQF